MGRRKVIGSWLLVVASCAAGWAVLVLVSVRGGHPSTIRVVGEDRDLWAYTRERVVGQGVDIAWWVSHDGGSTWRSGTPSDAVREAAAREQGCAGGTCFRLVEGWRIDQAEGEGTWHAVHRRPREDAAPASDAYRPDWVEERSIAVASGPDGAVAVVAAGEDGALVGSIDGDWRTVTVGHSWDEAIEWWVAGLGSAAIVVVGLGMLGIGLLLDRVRRSGREAASGVGPSPPFPTLPTGPSPT